MCLAPTRFRTPYRQARSVVTILSVLKNQVKSMFSEPSVIETNGRGVGETVKLVARGSHL